MSMNLYNYHSDSSVLAGFSDRLLVPQIALDIIRSANYWHPLYKRPVMDEIIQHRDTLARDPTVALRAAITYHALSRSLSKAQSEVELLWPRHSAVEKSIAADPQLIAKYSMDVVGVTPEYFDQILKSDASTLSTYILHFKQKLKDYPDFLTKAYVVVSEDPKEALLLAVNIESQDLKQRVRTPELEDAIYNWTLSQDKWRKIIDAEDLESVPYENEDIVSIRDPVYDSPWNLYLSFLPPDQRRSAVLQYGYKGRPL